MDLTDFDRQLLRDVAFASVEFGLAHSREMPVSELDFAVALRAEKATFVTLRNDGELVGCIGTLRAHRALVRDVVHNAYHAAFGDPRFAPLTAERFPGLDLHISILSPLEPLQFQCEDDLLAQLRAGIDGVVIEDGDHAATFLPAMWPRLGDARAFMRALKDKAYLPRDYWSPTLRAFRYTVDEL
jgi:AmmeMemoRadiSam system protein A